MTGQHPFQSVADMMRKQPSPAEAHLITPGWSRPGLLKNEGRARPN